MIRPGDLGVRAVLDRGRLRRGRERKRHAVVAVFVLPAFTHVKVVAHHAAVVVEHVIVDPVASHVKAMPVEVHVMTILTTDATADVERVLRIMVQRLMRREAQHVMVV